MKVKSYQPVLSLKPTQFAVGILEVEYKVLQLKKMKKNKLKKLIASTPIPVVISPWQELCILDHHHFLFACWHANIKKVKVEVIKDFSTSKLSYHKFWKKMVSHNYAYLYDQFGNGPRSPLYLPLDIRGLADDPYRSLAWVIRKEGGFENSDKSFAEFEWADFFREKKLLDSQGRHGFHLAVKKGLRILKKTAPRKLPGFIAKEKIESTLDVKPKKKTKYISPAIDIGPLRTVPRMKK
jgi:hypothetical protein